MSKPIKTFEETLKVAREILKEACDDTAKILGEPIPPRIEETVLPNGNVRLVVVWPDGYRSNECMCYRIDGQQELTA